MLRTAQKCKNFNVFNKIQGFYNMTKNIYETIGKRIRVERKKLSLTQEELASKAHIGTKFLSSIERCATKPSLETFIKISEALGISCDCLLKESPKQAVYKPDFSKQLAFLVSELSEDKQYQVLKLVKDIKKITSK